MCPICGLGKGSKGRLFSLLTERASQGIFFQLFLQMNQHICQAVKYLSMYCRIGSNMEKQGKILLQNANAKMIAEYYKKKIYHDRLK